MIRKSCFALAISLITSAALANVDRSPRPEWRESATQTQTRTQTQTQSQTQGAGLFPNWRKGREARQAARKERQAARARASQAASMEGAVCNNPAIKGVRVNPIPGRIRGCGIAEPVRITSVSGVTLSQSSTIDCQTARALNAWVKDAAKPEFEGIGGGLISLKVVAHYACRTRNNRKGARISEHGRGRAIDIAGFTLRNGQSISVLNGWRDPGQGPVLRKLHQTACGPFGTVLGPNSDRYHRDHFHFDTARYRSGPYCR